MELRDLLFLFLSPHLCFADVCEVVSLEADEGLVIPPLYPSSSIRVSIPANYESSMYAGRHLNHCSSCFSFSSHVERKHVVRDENGTLFIFEVPVEKKEVFFPTQKRCAKGEINLKRGPDYSVRMGRNEVVIKTGRGIWEAFFYRGPIERIALFLNPLEYG